MDATRCSEAPVFTVEFGTLVGIVGENCAGKSTLLRILVGDLHPSSGLVLRSGAMGYCPQQVILNDALSVKVHLDYFRAAYNMGSLRQPDEFSSCLAMSATAPNSSVI